MKIISVAIVLLSIYVSLAIVGYSAYQQGPESPWWFVGIGIFSILFGATAATITSVIRIYRRERQAREVERLMWQHYRESLWRQGRGRD